MDIDAFRASLAEPTPPKGATPLLKALWHAAREEWEAAHHIAQDVDSADGAWVHAYLHRVEGDEDNAGYWRSEEHTSELQSLMRISYAVFCLQKKKQENRDNR